MALIYKKSIYLFTVHPYYNGFHLVRTDIPLFVIQMSFFLSTNIYKYTDYTNHGIIYFSIKINIQPVPNITGHFPKSKENDTNYRRMQAVKLSKSNHSLLRYNVTCQNHRHRHTLRTFLQMHSSCHISTYWHSEIRQPPNLRSIGFSKIWDILQLHLLYLFSRKVLPIYSLKERKLNIK